MRDKIVYVHSINGVPFYVGSGETSRATCKLRSSEWNKIVSENKGVYETEIIFRGTLKECLDVEELYIEKYWDTLCNKQKTPSTPVVELKTISLVELKKKIGQDIKVARKKRRITTIEFAKNANIDRTTLYNIEKGKNYTMDALLNVLFILGMHNDFSRLIESDPIGNAMIKSYLLK